MNCKKILLLGVTLLALSACHYQRPSYQPPPGPDSAEVSLAEAARAVHQSLHQLSEIKRATAPRDKRLLSLNRYALPGKTTVDWSGPIEPLLKDLSKANHWKLVVLGKRPPIPVLITLTAVNEPTVYVLRDIDLQAGSKANLRVNVKKRLLELRYKRV